MHFYYSFTREQKQGQISRVTDKDAQIQESTMDEGEKKEPSSKGGRKRMQEGLL